MTSVFFCPVAGKINEIKNALLSPLHPSTEEWIKDTGEVIADELWVKGLNRMKALAVSSRLQLIQFKVIRPVALSKLKRVFSSVSATCDECESADVTRGHLFFSWSCPELTTFGIKRSTVIYNRQLVPDGLLVISGRPIDSLTLPFALQEDLIFSVRSLENGSF